MGSASTSSTPSTFMRRIASTENRNLQVSNGLEILSVGEYSTYRDLCHRVKTGERSSIQEAAHLMAERIPFLLTSVLIPMPSHLGYASDTLRLCNEISSLTGLPVIDALLGNKRESLYHLKRNGMVVPDSSFFGYHLVRDIPAYLTPVIVDNVIATGQTMKAAIAAVMKAIPCAIAVDNRLIRLIVA